MHNNSVVNSYQNIEKISLACCKILKDPENNCKIGRESRAGIDYNI